MAHAAGAEGPWWGSVEHWRSYLASYSVDVLRANETDASRDISDAQRAAGWLGQAGATEEAAYMDRVLLISGFGDAQFWLLDPGDVSPDGEWAANIWASWYPGLRERRRSFADLVADERRSFEELRDEH
ncbi:hypothetical protein [Streptomyces sp. NPDC127108]|uniref:hypothetical protein n=1 Tax=Streptomyces sp. NPDC127108 TaxID=3345361 RepID=UPI003626F110